MKKIAKKIALAQTLFCLALANTAFAESLKINPGLWEKTMTLTTTLLGSHSETMRECVTEDQFNPKQMMQDAKGREVV